MNETPESQKKHVHWPVVVATVIAFGLGMVVGYIENAVWGIVAAILGAALSVAIVLLAGRIPTK